MLLLAWIIRGILLLMMLPFLLPIGLIVSAIAVSPLSFAIFILVLALLALAALIGFVVGVLGTFADLIILLGLAGLIWKWPRGTNAPFTDKLSSAYRSLHTEVKQLWERYSSPEATLCLAIVIIALVLSISSGLFRSLLNIAIVLTIVGIVWKWPTAPGVPFLSKLEIALHNLSKEIRDRFRR